MLFQKRRLEEDPQPLQAVSEPNLLVVGSRQDAPDPGFVDSLAPHAGSLRVKSQSRVTLEASALDQSQAVLSVFQEPDVLTRLLRLVGAERSERDDGSPVLIVALRYDQLTRVGEWLNEMGHAGELEGIRLILCGGADEIPERLADKLESFTEPSVISMPIHTEIENSPTKLYFAISPQIRENLRFIRELSQNEITRLYLLGGPGSGKTSLAYYYWLCRERGRFITINLDSERTEDKAAMKSLMCGHVAGTFQGSGNRDGAFSFARDGVVFLDESHGVSGEVMQVLMECLDSGQYLPYGGTAKREVECAVIFASNRTWDILLNNVGLAEHARIGATRMFVANLSRREEDLIAVLATALASFKKQCVNWTAPEGITPGAWAAILDCPWNGNVRSLIRTIEGAAVQLASSENPAALLDEEALRKEIVVWEPDDHHSLEIYTSV